MNRQPAVLLATLCCSGALVAHGQNTTMDLPKTVIAGNAFAIQTTGNGKATFYLAGPGGAMRRDVQLGAPIGIAAGDLYSAGHYLAMLVSGSSSETEAVDVTPAIAPQTINFLASPSRLPVGLPGGISGTAYLFDAYHNLIPMPLPVSFQLSTPGSTPQARTVQSRNGVAWTAMNSSPRQGSARFMAQSGGVTSTRVIEEVPGDPCRLIVSARPDGHLVALETAPVKDCSGNAVPDGTIVTFTENYNGTQSTVDAPLKQGTARADMPAHPGATISVASGVVAGNEIHWGGRE